MSENKCVCCNEIIPEGRQVCPSCEKKTGNTPDCKIVVKPFSFNDKMADVALEDFSLIQRNLSYGACQTIGTALAKLKQMEDKGLNPDTLERILTRLEEKAINTRGNAIEMSFTGRQEIINELDYGMSLAYTDAIKIVKKEGGLDERL